MMVIRFSFFLKIEAAIVLFFVLLLRVLMSCISENVYGCVFQTPGRIVYAVMGANGIQ